MKVELFEKGESDGYTAAATTATEEMQAQVPADAVEACPQFFGRDMLT